jgi:hypothetical protein
MLRTLLVVAVLFTTSTAPHDAGKKNDGANLTQSNSNNEPSPSVSFVNNETAYPNKEPTQTESPHWYASPEWWLFILGIPSLFVVGKQAVLLSEHAEHLKELAGAAADNAKAAKLSAQAVVNAERAWLVIGFVKTNNTDTGALSEFGFTCRNPGKTPATVKRIDMGYRVVKDPLDLPIPMKEEDLIPVKLPDRNFIVSTDGFTLDAKVNPEEILFDKKGTGGFIVDIEFAVFYGRIVYQDVFDSKEPRETRWCFSYDIVNEAFVRAGPDEYNSHT